MRQHEPVPEIPVVTLEEPLVSCRNSRKKQENFPSMRDGVLFHCRVSREIPPSLLSLESVLYTLDTIQEIRQHTRLHSKGTPTVPPQLKKSPGFLSSSRDEGLFPCFVRKGIPAFPLHLKRRGSQLETQAELQGSCHNFKRSRCPTPLQRNLIPCSDSTVTLRIDTNMMAVVTALWHLKRSHRSLCQLDRNPDTSLTAREESGLACLT